MNSQSRLSCPRQMIVVGWASAHQDVYREKHGGLKPTLRG